MPGAKLITRLQSKSVLEVSGPDAQKFLKGLTSRDIEPTNGGYTGFLNASGRVLHTSFAFLAGPSRYLITHESDGHPAPLANHLIPFRLRSKVRIRDVSDQWDVWAAWGEAAKATRKWKLGSGGAAEATWEHVSPLAVGDTEIGCWDLRAAGMGAQILAPKGCSPTATRDHAAASQADYDLHRMQLGVPDGPNEVVPEVALPLESSMDIHGGIDFRKGCYLGQELTVRTYHTGATRKRILPVRFLPLENESVPLRELCKGSPLAMSGRDTADIVYVPAQSAASQKPKPAGRILAKHITTNVGLGLVRVELADRAWWHSPLSDMTVREWMHSGSPRLLATAGDRQWGLYVDRGEAFQASQNAQRDAS